MCGIVGYISSSRNGFISKDEDIIKELMYVSALRGSDSTGIFYVTNDGDVQIHKDAVDSAAFIRTTEMEAARKEMIRRGRAVVVHCRAATKGSKTEENAHPFVVDNRIVLVHNGTVFDHKSVKDTEVDSHAIAHRLAEEADVEKALQSIQGAYALAWYDVPSQKLKIIRNDQRPLYVCETSSGDIVFASEAGMLYWILGRNGIKFKKDEEPYLLKEGTLMEFDLTQYRHSDKFQTWDEKDIKYRYTPPKKEEGASTNLALFPKQDQANTAGVSSVSPQRMVVKTLGSPSYVTALQAAELIGHGEWKPEVKNLGNGATVVEYEAYHNYSKSHKEFLLEVIDYCPQDTDDPECDLYHVYGNVIDPNGGPLDGFAAYWEISAKKEEEVMAYATNGKLYKGKVEYFMGRAHSTITGIRTALCKFYGVHSAEDQVKSQVIH